MSGLAELEPGTTFAEQFRVIRKLAQGGMGAVYVAEQIATGRERALKLMHPGLVSSRELREKFALEARVGAKIASEHVVEVVSAGVERASGSPWLAMELLTGEDLATALKRRGAFSVEETVTVLAQVCHALGAAHAAGIVHRDLKPENLFLAEARRAHESYTVKVLDFGIAKVLEAARGSNTGAIGSPLWMAPEQTERHAEISPGTDVWALGLVAFTMLTGRSFWLSAEQTEMALSTFLRELVLDPIPTASERAAQLGVTALIPKGFDEWFARTVARDRTQRYANGTEAYGALCEQLGVAPPSTASRPSRQSLGGVASAEASAESDRLASAHTVPDDTRGKPPAIEGADDAALGTVPVEGPSLKLLTVGGIAVAAAVAAVAIFLLRARPDPSPLTDVPDASGAAMPFCPKGMVRVPGADTTIGSNDGQSEEKPAHPVTVAAFCIDATEVSVAEFTKCVDQKGCSDDHTHADNGVTKDERGAWSAFCNEGKPNRADHPMNCVSFDDAARYCSWAGKKLPTEEQWEYAARGPEGRAFPWGHEPPSAKRVNGCDDDCAKEVSRMEDTIARRLEGNDRWPSTSPTGTFPEGVGPFGSFDMAGNVAEWVDAPFCPYGKNACGTAARVVRGGSWMSVLPGALRTTSRAKASPASQLVEVGFRCAK